MDDPTEPPRQIWYDLEEALRLLSVLQDAHLELLRAGRRTTKAVGDLDAQILFLERKLFSEEGGRNGN